MKWENFIVPIYKSNLSSDVPYKILLSLFEQAGSCRMVSEATAKSWLKGSRNCKVSMYFPSGEVDTESLFRYFRKRPNGKLQQLQQIFRQDEARDFDSPIDVETDDLDIFCWSLVNQFLDLLGFHRIDIQNTDMLSEAIVVETSQSLDSKTANIPIDATRGREQDAVQQAGGTHIIRHADISKDREHSIISAILPHSGDCCYRCVYWEGNRETFGAYQMPTYGFCVKYNRDGQLSSTIACRDYKRRKKQIVGW